MSATMLRRWMLPAALLVVLFGLLASCIEGCGTPDDWGRDRAIVGGQP